MDIFKKKLEFFAQKKNSPLPTGFLECEYLEGTGTQFIDTGISPASIGTSGPYIRARYMPITPERDFDYFGQNVSSVPNGGIAFDISRNNTYIRWFCSNTNNISWIGGKPVVNNSVDFHFISILGYPNLSMTWDDAEYTGTVNITQTPSDRSVTFFRGRPDLKGRVRWNTFQIGNSSGIILSLLSALCTAGTTYTDGNTGQQVTAVSNKPGMYDTVSGRFFVNQNVDEDFLYKLKQ